MMASDATNRYVLPKSADKPEEIWEYPNQAIKHSIYDHTSELAMHLFGCRYADLRLLSGNNAVYCLINSLTKPGDSIFHVPEDCGGHFATAPICAREGVDLIDIPYNRETGEMDIAALKDLYLSMKPKLILLDASMILFPYPLQEIRDVVGPETCLAYDASHVMGLIGGKTFQDPLREGCNILNGSTHKTLFGPQKGIILCRDEDRIAEKISQTAVPMFVSSAHLHHIAALGVAFEEIRDYGKEYASQVISNAKSLAEHLDNNGIRVFGRNKGYTENHQLWCLAGSKKESLAAFSNLENIGIFVNMIKVPFTDQFGLRLGTAELSRRGLKENNMHELATIIKDCLNNNDSTDSLRERVQDISATHSRLFFCRQETE